ncbi:MAG: TIGR03790 family protein [Methylophilaceae bacterium]|nr:TIGR03790 family protein [Methylophilaceae bacterium]
MNPSRSLSIIASISLSWIKFCRAGVAVLLLIAMPAFARPDLQLPRTGLTAQEVAIIINDDDPLSVQTGTYYQKARQIPPTNVIHVRFPAGRTALGKEEFQQLKAQIDKDTPTHIQAYAVAWTTPYRVGCMSITSALAFGFNQDYCSATCGATKASPYFNSPSLYPATDLKMRPAMLLAGTRFEQVKALIDRGVASDHSFPAGHAYLLNTPDRARSVRSINFPQTAKELAGVYPIEILETGAIADKQDVLFYFTGLTHVPQLQTLGFQPGALADHLTSTGGQLTDSTQMSILRWLEAGATASYGTVIEPCNHQQKFPVPGIAMFFYATGATAIEAYWKSVAWPGEGVFVGEPLAKPFAPELQENEPNRFELRNFSQREGRVSLEQSATMLGPYKPIAQFPMRRGANQWRFTLPETTKGFLRLQW